MVSIVRKRAKYNTVDDNPSDGVLNTAMSANATFKYQIHVVALSLTYRLNPTFPLNPRIYTFGIAFIYTNASFSKLRDPRDLREPWGFFIGGG